MAFIDRITSALDKVGIFKQQNPAVGAEADKTTNAASTANEEPIYAEPIMEEPVQEQAPYNSVNENAANIVNQFRGVRNPDNMTIEDFGVADADFYDRLAESGAIGSDATNADFFPTTDPILKGTSGGMPVFAPSFKFPFAAAEKRKNAFVDAAKIAYAEQTKDLIVDLDNAVAPYNEDVMKQALGDLQGIITKGRRKYGDNVWKLLENEGNPLGAEFNSTVRSYNNLAKNINSTHAQATKILSEVQNNPLKHNIPPVFQETLQNFMVGVDLFNKGQIDHALLEKTRKAADYGASYTSILKNAKEIFASNLRKGAPQLDSGRSKADYDVWITNQVKEIPKAEALEMAALIYDTNTRDINMIFNPDGKATREQIVDRISGDIERMFGKEKTTTATYAKKTNLTAQKELASHKAGVAAYYSKDGKNVHIPKNQNDITVMTMDPNDPTNLIPKTITSTNQWSFADQGAIYTGSVPLIYNINTGKTRTNTTKAMTLQVENIVEMPELIRKKDGHYRFGTDTKKYAMVKEITYDEDQKPIFGDSELVDFDFIKEKGSLRNDKDNEIVFDNIDKSTSSTKATSEYTNQVTGKNGVTIGLKNGKWYDVSTGKEYK